MINQNPFEGIPASIVVDEVMGDSYRVVKAVYCELDKLKQIIESDNLQFIVSHFPDIQRILKLSTEIKEIALKLDILVKIPGLAESTQKDAQKAKEWATKMNGLVENQDYSAKWYANEVAKKYSEIVRLAKQVNDAATIIIPISNQIKILAGHVQEITVTVENIDVLKRIYQDLNTDHNIEIAVANLAKISEAVTYVPIFKEAIKTKEELKVSIETVNKILIDIQNEYSKIVQIKNDLTSYVDTKYVEIKDNATKASNAASSAEQSKNTTLTSESTVKNLAENVQSNTNKVLKSESNVSNIESKIYNAESRVNKNTKESEKYSLSAEASAGTAVIAMKSSQDAAKMAYDASVLLSSKFVSLEADMHQTNARVDMMYLNHADIIQAKDDAIAYSNSALESRTVAEASAKEAVQKAKDANTSAQSALKSAQDADASNTTATVSAQKAETSSREAQSYADNAQNSALESDKNNKASKKSAESAEYSAESAKSSELKSKSYADTASGGTVEMMSHIVKLNADIHQVETQVTKHEINYPNK